MKNQNLGRFPGCTFPASRPFAEGKPGEVVTARIRNPLEDPSSQGKARPAVLHHLDGGRWVVMGLTTWSRYANGMPRPAVPNPGACGLSRSRASFLWGRATWVSVLDVGDHLGYADPELLALIERAMLL